MAAFEWLTDPGGKTRIGRWLGVSAGAEVPPVAVDESYQFLTLSLVKDGAFGGPVGLQVSLDPERAPESFLAPLSVNGQPLARLLMPCVVTIYASVAWVKPEPGPGVKDVTVYLLGQR